MSKEVKDEPIVDLGTTINKSEKFFVENKKTISTAAIALVVLVGGWIFYTNVVVENASIEARPDLWKAAQAFDSDSLSLAMKGSKKDFQGFEDIAEEYSNTNEGNIAKYYLAVSYFRQQKFDEALEQIEAFDAKGEMFPHLKNGLLGDIYTEKNDNEQAIKKYVSAAQGANNVLISPYYLKKAAILSEQLGKNEDAVKYYEEIISAYYTDPMKHGQEKQKIERALGIVKAKATLKGAK
jgi:predicted negative regulator of RcsB-dependent stress response